MNVLCRVRSVAGTVALLVFFSSATMAAPLPPANVSSGSTNVADVTSVHWRGGTAGLAAGLATGLIMGSFLAAPRYYDEPYPYHFDDYPPRYGGPIGYGHPDWEAYCYSRYRSFDPVSGTYRARDGRRHYCQ